MPAMFVTLEVSNARGLLKADAEWNMLSMFVTLEVSNARGLLKADAKRNMEYMVVTREVSQFPIGGLQVGF